MTAQSPQHPTNRRLTTSDLRKVSRSEVAQMHRDNLRQRLEHRLQVAREQGDQHLIQMLEVEQRQTA